MQANVDIMPYLNLVTSKTADQRSSSNQLRSLDQLVKQSRIAELLTLKMTVKRDYNFKAYPNHPHASNTDKSQSPHQSQLVFPRLDKLPINMPVMGKNIIGIKKKFESPRINRKKDKYHKRYKYQKGKFVQIFPSSDDGFNTLNISQKPIHNQFKNAKMNDSFLNQSVDCKKDLVVKISEHIAHQSQHAMETETIIMQIKPSHRKQLDVLKTARNNTRAESTIEIPKRKERKYVKKFDGIYYSDTKYPQDPIFQEKYASMRHYFNMMNLANNMYIPPAVGLYKAYVGKGNNGMLVRQILKTRWWWTIIDEQEQSHFVWTQLKVNGIHEAMKSLKKSQSESFITNQSATSSTVGSTSYGFMKQDDQSDSELQLPSKNNTWNKLLTAHEIRQFGTILGKTGKQGKLLTQEQALAIRPKLLVPENMKVHNHLEDNFHLGNKKAFFYNMRAYYESQNQNVFSNLPLTFHIKSAESEEYKQFIEAFQRRQEQMLQDTEEDKSKLRMRNIWIIKPGEFTNRGNGISISEDLNEILTILNSKEQHKNGSYKTNIVQLYIDRPLLYNKRKFDIRCYSLLTSVNGNHKGYWYTEGYIRTSSKEFSTKQLTNKMIHLTNDAVQKKGDDYGRFEKGNKVGYEEFSTYVEGLGGDFNKIYQRMKQMAIEQFRAVYGKIDPKRRENTFELFGLDFMIDQQFEVMMIEVNTNPCIEVSCPILSKIIPTLLDNVLKIALDPLFPPPNFYNPKKVICDQYLDNKFELVFDEMTDGPQLTNENVQNYDIGLIVEESEDEEIE